MCPEDCIPQGTQTNSLSPSPQWLPYSKALHSLSVTWQTGSVRHISSSVFTKKSWSPVAGGTAEAQVILVVINLPEQLSCLRGWIILDLMTPTRRAAIQNKTIVPHHTNPYLFPNPSPSIGTRIPVYLHSSSPAKWFRAGFNSLSKNTSIIS